jgi:CTP:phosphocholine cytidylyltransferase-like protein
LKDSTVTNAIIMAAGFSSRFSPLSQICPKGLLPVKGEVLIERQIRQLQEANIHDIYLVVGYKKELFYYLKDKFQIHIIENTEYTERNNNSSIYAARDYLDNSYICSADNYFLENVFSSTEPHAYYSARYACGSTPEYCLQTDENGRITDVTIGGANSWYMFGHVYFDRNFSRQYRTFLEEEYNWPETKQAYWEHIFMHHLHELSMYIKKFDDSIIQEFDTLEDLKAFDPFYREHTTEELITYLKQKYV